MPLGIMWSGWKSMTVTNLLLLVQIQAFCVVTCIRLSWTCQALCNQCLCCITLAMVLKVSQLLETGVIIPWREVPPPPGVRMCRVGRWLVRICSFGGHQFVKDPTTLAFCVEAKLYVESWALGWREHWTAPAELLTSLDRLGFCCCCY